MLSNISFSLLDTNLSSILRGLQQKEMEREREQHQQCECCNKLIRLEEKVKSEKQTNFFREKAEKGLEREIRDFFIELEESNITKDNLLEAFKKTFEDVLKVRSRPFVNYAIRILDLLEAVIPMPNQEESRKEEPSTQSSVPPPSSPFRKQNRSNPQEDSRQQIPTSVLSSQDEGNEEEAHQNDLSELTNSLASLDVSCVQSDPSFLQEADLPPVPAVPEVPPPAASLPLQWERHPNFQTDGKTITSKFNGWYKMCSLDSLPKRGKYSFKFKVKTLGTVSFGVVVEQKKSGRFVDDRNFGCISYVSFANGGGMIRKDGEIIEDSQKVHISSGTTMEMAFDFNSNEVSFKNSRADHGKIKMSPFYLQQELYLFLHTKSANTVIELL